MIYKSKVFPTKNVLTLQINSIIYKDIEINLHYNKKNDYKKTKHNISDVVFDNTKELLMFTNNISNLLKIKSYNLIKNLNKEIILNYVGNSSILEINSFLREINYHLKKQVLYLKLDHSNINIAKHSNNLIIKTIKNRLLLIYSLSNNIINNFIDKLIKFEPTSSYRKSGIIIYNTLLKLKKKNMKIS